MSLLSQLTLAIGLCGLLGSKTLWQCVFACVVLVAVVRMVVVSIAERRQRQQLAKLERGRRWLGIQRFALAIGCVFAIVIMLGAMLPPWHFDVRAYHLTAPKEWYLSGHIGFVPHNVYANMPLSADMSALLAMVLWPGKDAWWWGAMVGKTVLGIMGLISAIAVYACGQRWLGRRAAIFAGLAFISTPWTVYLCQTGLSECVFGFYLLLSLHLLLLWRQQVTRNDTEVHADRTLALLMMCGLLAGSAAAVKYTAIVFVVIPMLLWIVGIGWPRRRTGIGIMKPVAVFGIGVLLACGLWYGKNAAMTHNPVYPLAYHWFGGTGWDAEKHARWTSAHSPQHGGQQRYSLRAFGASVQRIALSSTGQTALVLPFALAALVGGWRRRVVRPLFLFVLTGLAVWWLTTHRFDRFWTPLLPVIALLIGYGIAICYRHLTSRWVTGLVTICLAINLTIVLSRSLGDNRYFVSLAELRTDFPSQHDPWFSRVNPFHSIINQTLQSDDKILLVGDAAPFDVEVPCLFQSCFDDCRFEELFANRTAAERRAALTELGITHVYINWQDIDAYRRAGDYGYSNFVTRELVTHELVQTQRILEAVETNLPEAAGQLYRVTNL